MPFDIQIIGDVEAKKFYTELEKNIKQDTPTLFRSLGVSLVEDVKHRIRTLDNKRWAPASKWARAKSGQNFPTLLGAEKYVKARVTGGGLQIVGDTGKEWTLTQHHEGFTNQLEGPGDEHDASGRVVLKIKDATPLALYQEHRKSRVSGQSKAIATTFAFVPKRPGVTPARKIWPNQKDAEQIVTPIFSNWVAKVIEASGGKVIREY